jgi:hypothetical protein
LVESDGPSLHPSFSSSIWPQEKKKEAIPLLTVTTTPWSGGGLVAIEAAVAVAHHTGEVTLGALAGPLIAGLPDKDRYN